MDLLNEFLAICHGCNEPRFVDGDSEVRWCRKYGVVMVKANGRDWVFVQL